jgi:hypothetical protein
MIIISERIHHTAQEYKHRIDLFPIVIIKPFEKDFISRITHTQYKEEYGRQKNRIEDIGYPLIPRQFNELSDKEMQKENKYQVSQRSYFLIIEIS